MTFLCPHGPDCAICLAVDAWLASRKHKRPTTRTQQEHPPVPAGLGSPVGSRHWPERG